MEACLMHYAASSQVDIKGDKMRETVLAGREIASTLFEDLLSLNYCFSSLPFAASG